MNTVSNLMKTLTAGEALEANRRVKKSGNTIVYADAGEDSIGVTTQNAAINTSVVVKLWNDPGTFLITASGVIASNGKCYGANDGKVSATVSGEPVGTSNEEVSSADGDEIEIIKATPADLLAIQNHIADVAAVTQADLTLTNMTGTANTAPAAEINTDSLTDNGGGTADGTVAAQAAPVTVTDSTGKDATHSDTINPNAAPACAGEATPSATQVDTAIVTAITPLLQNESSLGQKIIELVTLAVTAQNNLKEVTTELAKQRDLNIVLANNCKSFATQLNAAKADNAAQATKINEILAALEAAGIMKAS